MRNYLLSLTKPILLSLFIVLWLINSVCVAQEPAKPSTPAVSQDEVIRISTDLVQTGVTVLDKQGRFVPGLDRAQFELLVDGKPQSVSFFEQIAAGSGKDMELIKTHPNGVSVAEKGSTSQTNSNDRGRTVFFFVDDIHLAPDSVVRTQAALRRYVDNLMGPLDRAAITTASGQLGFLQQLTSDKSVLRKAIDRITYRRYDVSDNGKPPMSELQALAIVNNDREVFQLFAARQLCELLGKGDTQCPFPSGMTNNGVYDDSVARARKDGTIGGNPTGTSGTSNATVSTSDATGLIIAAANVVRSRAKTITARSASITSSVLSSLESLIRTAASLPERKLVIFISDGFFINYLNSSRLYDLRRITDAAIRTGAVIYTVDAHGLTSGVQDATTSGAIDRTGTLARINMGEQTAQQNIFHTLAAETGGDQWINSNAMDPGISKAVSETSAYYLLAWRPETPGQAKDRFRRIEVHIKGRPDLTVRVQGGFFDEPPASRVKTDMTSGIVPKSADDELSGALRAAYPLSTLPMSLSVGYLNTVRDGMVLAASIQIGSGPVSTSVAAGGEVDVLGAAIDDSGKIVSTLKQRLGPAAQSPLVYTMQFPSLPPGLYQVRVAARDGKTGQVGSALNWIEIPETNSETLSLSSIFLSAGVPGAAASQKPVIKPDQRFPKSSRLRFQTYVYGNNRATSPANLVLEIQLIRDGQTVVATPPGPVSTEGVTDLARIPVIGEFLLESFSTGRYKLKVIVTDSKAKSTASQQIDFTID